MHTTAVCRRVIHLTLRVVLTFCFAFVRMLQLFQQTEPVPKRNQEKAIGVLRTFRTSHRTTCSIINTKIQPARHNCIAKSNFWLVLHLLYQELCFFHITSTIELEVCIIILILTSIYYDIINYCRIAYTYNQYGGKHWSCFRKYSAGYNFAAKPYCVPRRARGASTGVLVCVAVLVNCWTDGLVVRLSRTTTHCQGPAVSMATVMFILYLHTTFILSTHACARACTHIKAYSTIALWILTALPAAVATVIPRVGSSSVTATIWFHVLTCAASALLAVLVTMAVWMCCGNHRQKCKCYPGDVNCQLMQTWALVELHNLTILLTFCMRLPRGVKVHYTAYGDVYHLPQLVLPMSPLTYVWQHLKQNLSFPAAYRVPSWLPHRSSSGTTSSITESQSVPATIFENSKSGLSSRKPTIVPRPDWTMTRSTKGNKDLPGTPTSSAPLNHAPPASSESTPTSPTSTAGTTGGTVIAHASSGSQELPEIRNQKFYISVKAPNNFKHAQSAGDKNIDDTDVAINTRAVQPTDGRIVAQPEHTVEGGHDGRVTGDGFRSQIVGNDGEIVSKAQQHSSATPIALNKPIGEPAGCGSAFTINSRKASDSLPVQATTDNEHSAHVRVAPAYCFETQNCHKSGHKDSTMYLSLR